MLFPSLMIFVCTTSHLVLTAEVNTITLLKCVICFGVVTVMKHSVKKRNTFCMSQK